MKEALITGANRGIGLELCKQLKKRGLKIWAICRQVSPELKKLETENEGPGALKIIEGIDVTSQAALDRLNDLIPDHCLDLVINNAGILSEDEFDDLNRDDIVKQFQVNALAPLMVTRTLIHKFKNPAKLAMITSRMGSMADNTSGGYYGYRASKAALNAFAKSLSLDLQSKAIAVAILHPGYVKTDMTHQNGDRTAQDSAQKLIERIEALTLKQTGSFWHCDGPLLPW